MTISTTVTRAQYDGDDSTTTFPYAWKIFAEGDLTVILTDVDGVDATLVLDTDYTVTGAGDDAGGNVEMAVAPATGEVLTVILELELIQETDLTPNDPLPAEVLEDVFDRQVLVAQQLDEKINRSLLLPASAVATGLTLPAPEAGLVLAWNPGEDGLENVSAVPDALTSAFTRTLLEKETAAAARTTLDAQQLNANLTALAGLAGAADKLAYFTGASALSLADFTSFARTILDDANAATARATLGAEATAGPRVGLILATRDLTAASGDVAYTGLGFTPTFVLILGCRDSTLFVSLGVSTSSADLNVAFDSGANWRATTSYAVFLGTGSDYQSALVKTMDADGLTLTWTKTNSPIGTANVAIVGWR